MLIANSILQALLPVWHGHTAQPVQHVCQLSAVASGHHRGPAEAGDGTMVQAVRPILAATQALAARRAGV